MVVTVASTVARKLPLATKRRASGQGGSVVAKTNFLSAIGWWSQRIDATLYLKGTRWSVLRWVRGLVAVLRLPRRRSCGIAGSGESRLKRLGERLISRHRRFITRSPRTVGFVRFPGA